MYMYLCVCWCSYCIDCCGCNQKNFYFLILFRLLDANLFRNSSWSSILRKNGVDIIVRISNHAQLSTETTFLFIMPMITLLVCADAGEASHRSLRIQSALHWSADNSLQIFHWRFEANKQWPTVTPSSGKGVKTLDQIVQIRKSGNFWHYTG